MKRWFLLVALIVSVIPSSAPAASRDADFVLSSSVLGEDVAMTVYLPASYQTGQESYPCLYILEDDLYHRALTGMLDTRARTGSVPEMIVVGVATGERWRDFTPTRAGVPGGEEIPVSGGSARHREFLARELIPYVEEHFRTQPYRILLAHSLAGLHALDTLIEAPDLFGAYLVTSPSLWWDDEVTTRKARERLPQKPARLFLATGDEGPTIEDPVDRFCAVLREAAPEERIWRRTHHLESSHQELPIRAFCDGLDFVYEGWQLPAEALDAGVEAVDRHYAMLTGRYGYPIAPSETVINRLGYRTLGTGDIEGALALFERNVATHSGSANVHDSLGEALRTAGRIDEARASYERALALDPESHSARRALEELAPARLRAADACAAEVASISEFFAGWYRGELERTPAQFERLERALAPDFRFITPDGTAVDRALLLQVMESEWGTKPDLEMWTCGFRLEEAAGDSCVFVYEEHGQSAGRRKATLVRAVVRESAAAPNGLQWVRLSESELEP